MTVHVLLFSYIMILGTFIYLKLAPYRISVTVLGNKRYVDHKALFLFFALIPLLLVHGLRAPSVGTDTIVYVKSYPLILKESFEQIRQSSWELFFMLFNKAVGMFSDNPQTMIFFASCVIVLGLGLFIYKSLDGEESAFIAMIVFFAFMHYVNSMNLLRQYLAMAFLMQIYWVLRKGITKKRLIIAILLIIMAMQFHSMSFIGIVVIIPFLFKRITKRHIFYVFIASVTAAFALDKLLSLFLRFFVQYQKYIESFRITGEGFGPYYIAGILVRIAFLYLVLKLAPDNEDNQELYRLSFIGVVSCALLLFKFQISLSLRLSYFLDIYFVVMIPKILNRIGKGKVPVTALLVLYGIVSFLYILPSTERGCVPYLFFWQ